MSDLPSGWEWATLDDLSAPEPRAITDGPFGSNLKTSHYVAVGPRVIRLQNIGFGDFIEERAHISEPHFEGLRAHEVRSGDLVVASLGQDLPRSCIVPDSVGSAIVKADCIRVRLHPDLDAKYVNYALQRPALRHAVAEQIHGVGRPRLGMAGIRQLSVPVAPQAEQARIVAALEEYLSRLDGAVTTLRAAGVKIDAFRLAAIQGVFASRDWPWTTLGDIADLKGGVTKDAKREDDPSFVEVPYLRVANVQRGYLDLGEVTTIPVSPDKAKGLELVPGDILFNEGGDRDKLGRGWVWDGQIAGCIHQNHVFRARLRGEDFDPRFVSTHGNTWGQRWFEQHGKQTTNLASINLATLKRFPVPAPPIAEQRELMDQLDLVSTSVDALEITLHAAQRRAAALRTAVLAAAFSGQLSPQDPHDKPASFVLDRIRSERATATSVKRSRKVKAS